MAVLAARIDDEVAGFARKLAGQAISPAGELRVTTNDTLLVHLLTPLFAAFCARCPDVRLDVVLSNQALNLSKRDADVAIRATDNPPETPGGVDLVSLYERPWIALGDHFGGVKAARFVRERVAPEKIVYKVNTVLGLAEAVEAGIGIGPLPCFIADPHPALVRLSPPNPDFSTGLWLLTHPDLRQSARVRVFLDFVAAEIVKLRRAIEG